MPITLLLWPEGARLAEAGLRGADRPDRPPPSVLLVSTRLAVLSSSLTHWKKLPPLPSLTSQPHQVLASEPIPFSDLQQVSHPWARPCLPFPHGPSCGRGFTLSVSEAVGKWS